MRILPAVPRFDANTPCGAPLYGSRGIARVNSSSTVANGIGQPVRRKEDLRLLIGRGSFADDVSLPELAHAVIVRSPMPMRILHPSTKEQRLGRLVCSRCSPAATMWR